MVKKLILGGTSAIDGNWKVIEEKADEANLSRLKTIDIESVIIKIADAPANCDPNLIFINDDALSRGQKKKPAMKNHNIHYYQKEEQGRITDRTSCVAEPHETINPLTNRVDRDKAIYPNRGNDLSEQKFITYIQRPDNRVNCFAATAPGGCSKTTTAMAGNQCVGDDLAQMWIDGQGYIKSINPESVIFGIVEEDNREDDPKLMKLLRESGTEVARSNDPIGNKKFLNWNGKDPPTEDWYFPGGLKSAVLILR